MEFVVVNKIAGPRAVELVERKGLGHPDTICDALAEELSQGLSQYYLEHFGRVLHHNVDKALLSAGAARAAFGAGEVLEPIRIFLGGRAARRVGAHEVPVEEIAAERARRWFRRHLPQVELERHVRIHCQVHPGSPELVHVFDTGQSPRANDTSFGVGHAPLSALERLVLDAEETLNSESFRAGHPEAGADVKVAAMRHGAAISLTAARAFIGSELHGISDYLDAKHATARCLEALARERGMPGEVLVNAADEPERGEVYLTVLGTSAECGDDGQVGRGNRANGLITPHEPMSLEAVAGKNPITHVGKLYNVLALEMANDLVASIPEVKAARCYLASRIGAPIDEPHVVHVEIETHDATPADALAAPAEQIARAHLAALPRLSERIIAGLVRLY